MISEGWEEKVGGKLEFEADWRKIVEKALAHIDAKRKALKLEEYNPQRYAQSATYKPADYMSEDESRARYFAFLSFFSFSMTGLVLSSNLFQTFLFWELVGLTSYLLIGFWYQKPSAATAARKAFVINRLADLGFYLGILLLFMMLGSVNFLDMQTDVLQGMPFT